MIPLTSLNMLGMKLILYIGNNEETVKENAGQFRFCYFEVLWATGVVKWSLRVDE